MMYNDEDAALRGRVAEFFMDYRGTDFLMEDIAAELGTTEKKIEKMIYTLRAGRSGSKMGRKTSGPLHPLMIHAVQPKDGGPWSYGIPSTVELGNDYMKRRETQVLRVLTKLARMTRQWSMEYPKNITAIIIANGVERLRSEVADAIMVQEQSYGEL